MKLCKDCKYCRRGWLVSLYSARCTHPISLRRAGEGMVDGRTGEYCSWIRQTSDCGSEAKLFEAAK